MKTQLELYCLVEGDSTNNAFPVDIDSDQTVGRLKKAIFDQTESLFKGILANKLTLFSATIPPSFGDKPIWVEDLATVNPPPTELKELRDDIPDLKSKRQYIIVRGTPSAHTLPQARAPSPSLAQREAFRTCIEKVKEEFFQPGTPISDLLRKFVEGDLSLPEADCCVKGLPKAWLRSSSFDQDSSRPALYLLHPTKPHQTTSTTTPPSVAALETISKFKINDFISFFGVSGCGKTRAVVEMLAQKWGFYLNGSQADRGSKDVTTLFETAKDMPARYLSSDRATNGVNIQVITCCLLFARLLVLEHCLSLGCQDKFTCERWMLLQMCPGAFEPTVPDVFDSIFRALLDVYYGQRPMISLPDLRRLLQDQFHLVQVLLSSYVSGSPHSKFLIVLDEAQTLSDHGKSHFVSSADSGDLRSILSPIIHGLRNISNNTETYCVVTCGTGIGPDEIEVLMSSVDIEGIMAKFNRRIDDFPGWETVEQVATYVNSLGDLMCEDDKSRLRTLIPETAIQELFFRLRGRFRPIVSTIEEIIAKGTPPYWKEAIEQRVRSLVDYPDRLPVRGNLCSDFKRMLNKIAKDPAKFKDTLNIRHVLRQTVVFRASLGLPWSLKGEEAILVESAFARLRIAADQAAFGKTYNTTIDEPFVFQAAYNFIKKEDKGFYDLFREQYRDLHDFSSEGKIFERHAPLDLIHAFHGKKLKRELFSIPKPAVHNEPPKIPIPNFEPVTFPKHMFDNPVTIVGWKGYEWGARHKDTLTMHDFLEAHYRNGSRKDGGVVPPFFYPESSPSGPDIVFVLRINNELYPVFAQTKLLSDIFPGDAENARLTLHESRIKDHLQNLASYCPGGKYLSLIYVHPTITKTLREGWERDDLWDLESESGVNHGHTSTDVSGPLMQLLMIIDGSNMREFVSETAVELLDRVKGIKRGTDHSGSSGRAEKKRVFKKQYVPRYRK